MILTGFYMSSDRGQPLTYEQTISYVWLGQALFALIPFREDAEIAAMIRTGSICYELVRPVRLYAFWFARAIAQATAPVLLRAVPMVLLAAFVFPLIGVEQWALHGPDSGLALLLFFVSVGGAVLLAAGFSLIMSITLFWTIASQGVGTLLPVLVWTMCGIVIPIPFFPDSMQAVLNVLPFRGLMDIPFRIYVGSISANEAGAHIAMQIGWIAAFVALGIGVLNRGLRRVVVQGG